MSIDYANIWFYKIASKDPTILDCYIGYSRASWEATKNRHIQNSNFSIRPVHKFIREHGGFDNFNIIKIASATCGGDVDVSRELHRCLKEYNPTLNLRKKR